MPPSLFARPSTGGSIEVPLLTDMIKKSKDVDLIPGVHVDYLYPFRTDSRLILLPAIRES